MNHLNQAQIEQLRSALLNIRQQLEQGIELNGEFGLSESMRDMSGELSVNDNHPADNATELYERSKDYALQEKREHTLEQVMLALESMNTGMYGKCVVCDRPIPFERLEVIPYAPYCISHADQDISYRRPVEEQFLMPPFGRTSMDGHDQTGFDGEDAWQIVASWGTSSSPALAEDRQIEDYDQVYIEEDEGEGFVEPMESFLATDLYGDNVSVVRNKTYYRYLDDGEGDRELEALPDDEENGDD